MCRVRIVNAQNNYTINSNIKKFNLMDFIWHKLFKNIVWV